MATSRRGSHRAVWLFTFLFTSLLLLSAVKTLRSGFGVTSHDTERHFAVHRRQENASISTPIDSSNPTTPGTETTVTTPPPTTPATTPANTPTTDPATTPGSDPASTPTPGSDTTPAATPTDTPVDSSPAPSTSPGASGSGNSGGENGSSSGNSGSGTPPSSNGSGGTTGSSDGASGSPSGSDSGSTSGGTSPAPGSASGGTASGNRNDNGNENSATPSATPKNSKQSQPSSTPFTRTQEVTSTGKPVTLGPLTKTTDKATVISSTGADGKVSSTTKHVLSTFVTTPVSTPKKIFTTTSTGFGAVSTSDAAANRAHDQKPSSGMSGAAKAAVGVLVPLLAIAAAGGVALYLLRKKRRQHGRLNDFDDEKRSHISPPMTATSVSDSHTGFAGLTIPSSSASGKSNIFDPTIPAVQTRSPVAPMLPPVHPAPSGAFAATEAASAGATGAGLLRSNSNVSSITTVSSTSRYSRTSRYSHYSTYSQEDGRGRTPSPPPPLPDMLPNGPRFLDPSSYNGSAHGSPAPSLNPFVDPPSTRTSVNSSNRLSSTYFFDSDNAAAASMIRAGSLNESKRNSTYVIPDTRNGPLGDSLTGGGAAVGLHVTNDSTPRNADATRRMSMVSDASSSGSARRYSSGEAAVTPGGRTIPPLPLMSNGATGPEASIPEPAQSQCVVVGENSFAPVNRGNNNSMSNAMKRRSSYSTAAPRLPQLVEEDSSFGFSFEFSGSSTPGDLTPRPQTSPETKTSSTPGATPPRSRDGGSDGSSIGGGVENGRTDPKGMRGRALSTGYRRYRPDNL